MMVCILNLVNFFKVLMGKFFKAVKAWPSAASMPNKVLGFALCFIGISAARLVLYFTYSTHGHV